MFTSSQTKPHLRPVIRKAAVLVIFAQTLFLLPLFRGGTRAGVRAQVFRSSTGLPKTGTLKQGPRARQARSVELTPALLGGEVNVRAAGRGLPWINLTDGRGIIAEQSGTLAQKQAMASQTPDPKSLVSADLDEDGVPDLVAAYATDAGGMLSIYRGNIDSIFPNSPEALQRNPQSTQTISPFLGPAQLVDVPTSPDFVVSGDFNADGHQDIAVASRGSKVIYVLKGDGKGGLTDGGSIQLPGKLTALASGDVNRIDGLADLVAAVDGASGPALLVYEGVQGALRAAPEAFALPGRAASVAIGVLDADYFPDIAVGAGNQLIVIHGRDRALSRDLATRSRVPAATVTRQIVDSKIQSIAIGRFSGSANYEVGVLSASGAIQIAGPDGLRTMTTGIDAAGAALVATRTSGLPSDDLLMINPSGARLQLWMDQTQKSLREQKTAAGKSTATSNTVTFDVSSEPSAVLPMRLNGDGLSDLVVLAKGQLAPSVLLTQAVNAFCVTVGDSTNGPGSLGEAITAANNTPGPSLIVFNVPHLDLGPGLPAITGTLTIDGSIRGSAACGGPGAAQGSGPLVVNGGGSPITPVFLEIQGTSCVIRGLAIQGYLIPILIDGGVGCFVEAGVLGTGDPEVPFPAPIVPVNDGAGVTIQGGQGNIVAGNIISSNGTGVSVIGGRFNQVVDNFIGTDDTGQGLAGNLGNGVELTEGSTFNFVGGASRASGNVIAGNGDNGVFVDESSNGNGVSSNEIAANAGSAVWLSSAGNGVGGPTAGNAMIRNANGVEMEGGTSVNNAVQGNTIGVLLDPFGKILPGDVANLTDGITITNGANQNLVGGLNASAGNLIAFNDANGVSVSGATHNSILSNLIFSNLGTGILLSPGANDDQASPQVGIAHVASVGLTGSSAMKADASESGVTPEAAATVTISGTVNSTANSDVTLQFWLGGQCQSTGHQFIGLIDILLGTTTVRTTAGGSAPFSVSLTLPQNQAPSGIVNATATDSGGSTSSFSQCTAITAAGCSLTCPPNQTVKATSASGAVVTYSQANPGGVCAASTPQCSPGSGSTFPVGTTTVNCTVSDSSSDQAACSFSVTVQAAGPTITSVTRSGKDLVVVGSGFDSAAVVLVDSVAQTTTAGPANTLTAKKAFAHITPGATANIQVRNGDGSTSPGVPFMRPS